MFHSGRTPERFPMHVEVTSSSLCVTRKDEVVLLRESRVTGEACFVLRLIDWFAVDEPAESPTAACSVLFGILDHDLNGRGAPGNESLELSQGAVVLNRRHMLPGNLGQDRAVRKGKRPLPISRHRYRVSENAPEFVQNGFVRRSDQLPLTVAGGDCDSVNR